MSRVLLEVCTATVDDALAAMQGGADRLELNAGLELGGLTPSPGVFLRVRELFAKPIWVMIRPRPGGFLYSPEQIGSMVADAKWFIDHGADGVVFGVLTRIGEIDSVLCRHLLACGPATFHRAFDLVPRPHEALEQLIQLGFKRVMTSGQQPTTPEGCSLIKELIAQANGRIEILPAGGITPDNAGEIVARTNCDQVHASLRSDREDPSAKHRPEIRFGPASGDGESRYRVTDTALVRKMRSVLDGLHERPG